MKNKLLTLAVPTYNMEKYLARCLDSVLCDNKDYLEVLVVNDGSKDRSSEIGHKYEAKYPDVIRVIDKENGNYGTCVNRALAEAKGKYFRMLDADDWCNTDALNQWLEELKTCDADMVLTVAEDRDENNELLKVVGKSGNVQRNHIYNYVDFDGIKLGFPDLFCSHIVTYKTSLLKAIGLELQAGISYTDNEYVFFPLDHIQSVIYYDLPVYQYFVGREGQTTSPDVMIKHSNQMLQVFDRLLDYYISHRANQQESVLNNQRILLNEMLQWLYSPLFYTNHVTKENHELLEKLEQRSKQDHVIYTISGKRNRMLRFYRKTGLYIDSPIAIAYQKTFRLIRRFL